MIPYGASDPSFTMESKLGHKRVDVFRAFINDFKNVLWKHVGLLLKKQSMNLST